MEQWKSLEPLGFGKYKVSDDGRVRNIAKGNELKGKIRQGYRYFYLYDSNRKTKEMAAHRLVVLTFIGQPDNSKMTCDHIDRNKLNNKIENLRWATPREQNMNRKLGDMESKIVMQYDLNDNFIRSWKSAKEAANALNLNKTRISSCCYGSQNTSGGFKWKYIKEEVDPTEIWKIVNKAKYGNTMVSNKGRVTRHLKDPTKGCKDNREYFGVSLTNRNTKKKKHYQVHRLVAKVFIGPPIPGYVVNHKNGNKLDNNIDNLEYMTSQQNSAHAQLTGLVDMSSLSKPIICIDPISHSITKYYKTISDASADTNITPRTIRRLCNDHPEIYGGYIWAYASDPLFKEQLEEFMKNMPVAKKREIKIANYEVPVVKIDPLENKVVGHYDNIKTAAKENDIRTAYISGVLRGLQKTTRGYKWAYASDPQIKNQLEEFMKTRTETIV